MSNRWLSDMRVSVSLGKLRYWLTREDVFCIISIILIATAFVAPALRPGYTLLPLQWVSRVLPWSTYINEPLQNTVIGDPFFAFYPRRLFFTEAVRSGELPFWNPYVLGGYPAVGDTNAQTFYPFNLLAAFCFSAARSFSILAWFHLALTGVLMFAMLRSYKLHYVSSLFGAISWMLSGILIVWLEHPHRLSSFAWLPGLFWSFNLGNQHRRFVFPVAGGLFFSLMFLGGQPQYAALGGGLLGVYAVSCAVKVVNGRLRCDRWPLTLLAITAFIGLGLGSLQLLPALEFVSQSHRRLKSVEVWLRFPWPLRHLTTFWLPNLFGSAKAGSYPFWGGVLNYVEYTFYFGSIAFLLCLAAPMLSRQKRIAWLWSAVIILTTLVALGSPLAYLAKWIPGMTYFALHRMMSHVPFIGVWLAALAFDGVIHRSKEPRVLLWLLVCSGGLLIATGVVLYTYWPEVQLHWDGVAPELLRQGCILTLGVVGFALMRQWRRVGLIAILLISTADLFGWGWAFNPVSDLSLLYPENEVSSWLKQDTSLYRVLPLNHGERIFGENLLSVFHIGTPDGYLALTLRRHKELMYAIDPYFEGEERKRFRGPHPNLIVVQNFHPLHSMLNIKYVLSSDPLEEPQLRYAATFHGVYIYENLDVLPRAYVVHRIKMVPDDEVMDAIVSPEFDFHTTVLVSEPLTPEQQLALDESPVQDDSHVQIIQYTPNRVRLAANMEHAGLLVLADPCSSGWHARIDGESAEIKCVNHALRALFVSAGWHSVEFVFYPESVIMSAVIAVVVCVVGLVLVSLDLSRVRSSGGNMSGVE